jgi:signal transduction histidine kinase/ActR/RegA family two-component response regulator
MSSIVKSSSSQRRFKLIFLLCFLTAGLALFCFFIGLRLGLDNFAIYHLITVFIYLLAAYAAKKGYLNSARIVFFIFLNIGITATASYIGKAGSVEYMFMYSLALPFVLFSFRNEKLYVVFFSCLSGLLWIILYATNFNLFTSTPIDQEIAGDFIYPISAICTITMVTFQLMYFSFLNIKYYSKIHEKRLDAIEASQAKSKFLSTMSHEIRTPLNAVIGLSHILRNNNPEEDQIDNIEALNYSGKILLNLLNNVLDFSKMQSTSIQLDNIPTDLTIAIKQIKKIHEATCLRKGISMNLEIDDDIPVVWLDIVRYNQVINNLVTNAIKFTDNGSVTLKIKKVKTIKDQIILSTEVKDTGIGIPKVEQKLIWNAFVQASASTNRLYGGTGLGLPIVKGIVEAMGSKVKISSKINKGSRFYFNLKLKIASDKEVSKSIEKKEHNFEGKKVLLVDDNLINIMVGKQILEKAKLKVAVANDGLKAVNMLKEEKIDIILMDLQMPIMDGYEAAKEIRVFNKNVPILALSGAVFMEVKDKIFENGMNGFIYKPFDPEDLLNQIEVFTNSKIS